MNMIWRFALSSLLALPVMAVGQSTLVTATVVDQSSTVWANGTWGLDFVPNPNSSSPPYWNNNPFPSTQWHYSGALNASGQFTQSVPSNSFITPAGSTYTIKVCPNATSACVTIQSQTIQGTNMNISSLITANTPAPSVNAGPLAVAYNDNQVNVNTSQVGYFYLNSTTNTPRYWNATTWANFGGSMNSVTLSNFPPLFAVSNSGTATDQVWNFAKMTTAANTVYANCTGAGGLPSFCAITATMLPATITSDTSGNAATATRFAVTPTLCSVPQWSLGIGPAGNSSCQQPGFTNLSGNIAMSQINNGTNANNTHYLRGDNTWATLPTAPNIQSASNGSVCTTSSTSFSTCSTTITWPIAFADAAYQAVCFGVQPTDSRAYIDGILTKSASAVSVQVVTGGSVAVSYSIIDCIAVHP